MIVLLKAWVAENLSWLGFVVMTTLGGVIAHLKSYEAAKVEWTAAQHAWGLLRKMIYAVMAGFIVYLLFVQYHWSQPMSFIYTAIAAIFAADLFDILWLKFREKLALIFGGTGNGKENR